MFLFTGKTVLIISLERWGRMKISKHHYALELANRGCHVFFIEPPDLALKGTIIRPCPDHPLIRIVNYRPVFRGRRFLPRSVYLAMVRVQAKRIINSIGRKPDIVFCFQGYLFEDLRFFGAQFNIFFAADHFDRPNLPPELESSHLILTVSETISRTINKGGFKTEIINHGLQRAFARMGEERLRTGFKTGLKERPTVGYSGNLRMEAIDRDTMLEVIRSNPHFTFVFWGSFRVSELNLFGLLDADTQAFLDMLQSFPNVLLRGSLPAEELVSEMSTVDVLWICWRFKNLMYRDNSNSHKILEYLSTGIPVISNTVSRYEGTGLIYMLPLEHSHDYPDFFRRTIDVISKGEDPGLFERRIRYALDNTYTKQLELIEAMINSLQP